MIAAVALCVTAAAFSGGSPALAVRALPGSRAVVPRASVADDEGNTVERPTSPLAALAATQQEDVISAAAGSPSSAAQCSVTQTPDERRRSLLLAIAAPLAATGLYAFQRANPVNPIRLLSAMEARSPALPDALSSGTPTVVECVSAIQRESRSALCSRRLIRVRAGSTHRGASRAARRRPR
jgi:hypothetical protein